MNILKGYSVGFLFSFVIHYISEFFTEYSPAPKAFYLYYSWIGILLIFPLFIYVFTQILLVSKVFKHNRTKGNTLVVAGVIGFFSGLLVLKNMGII